MTPQDRRILIVVVDEKRATRSIDAVKASLPKWFIVCFFDISLRAYQNPTRFFLSVDHQFYGALEIVVRRALAVCTVRTCIHSYRRQGHHGGGWGVACSETGIVCFLGETANNVSDGFVLQFSPHYFSIATRKDSRTLSANQNSRSSLLAFAEAAKDFISKSTLDGGVRLTSRRRLLLPPVIVGFWSKGPFHLRRRPRSGQQDLCNVHSRARNRATQQ